VAASVAKVGNGVGEGVPSIVIIAIELINIKIQEIAPVLN